jgi:hypothetical protein
MPQVTPDVPSAPARHGSLFVLAAVNAVTVTTLVLLHHEPGGSAPADLVSIGALLPGLAAGAVLHWADIVIAGVNLVAVLLCLVYARITAQAPDVGRRGVFDGPAQAAAEPARSVAPVSVPSRSPEPVAAAPLADGLDEFPSEADSPSPRRVAS